MRQRQPTVSYTAAWLTLVVLIVFGTAVPVGADTGRTVAEFDPWDGGRADISSDGEWVGADTELGQVHAFHLASETTVVVAGPCSSFFFEQACDWHFTPAGDIVSLDRGAGTLTLTRLPSGARSTLADGVPAGSDIYAQIRSVSLTGVLYEVDDWNAGEVSLYHASLDGSDPVVLTSQPTNGPSSLSHATLTDGTVVFVDTDWYRFDPVSGVTTPFDPGPDAPVAPVRLVPVPGDARVIAFGSDGATTVPVDGSPATVLSDVPGENEWSAFTSDGAYIVYGTRRDPDLNAISVAPVDGSAPAETIVDDAPFNTSWAVTDTAVVYALDHAQRPTGPGLYATALDGSTTWYMTSDYPGSAISSFVLSEDGERVAAVVEDGDTTRLVVLDVDGGPAVSHISGQALTALHLSPDSVLFAMRIDDGIQVMSARPSGGVLTSLTRAPAHWADSSTSILYADSDRAVWVDSTYLGAAAVRVFAASDTTPSDAVIKPGGTFTDDGTSSHRGWIEAISAAGITAGCEADRYCPSAPITRQQMATFIARAFDLPPATSHGFADVTPGNVHGPNVAAIAQAGVSLGCDPAGTLFCPDDVVTRQQMASFLARAIGLADGTAEFADVTSENVHGGAIAAMGDAQITVGCNAHALGPELFCPSDTVIRAQMATFLGRALDLNPLYPG